MSCAGRHTGYPTRDRGGLMHPQFGDYRDVETDRQVLASPNKDHCSVALSLRYVTLRYSPLNLDMWLLSNYALAV
jgi:hypothetical protein